MLIQTFEKSTYLYYDISIFACNTTKRTHHNESFVCVITLKCSKLENKVISYPVCNLIKIVWSLHSCSS